MKAKRETAIKRQYISKKTRFEIFSRDSFSCRYCGRQSDSVVLEIDHVIPVCEGGTSDVENLITSCFDCNRGKADNPLGSHTPSEADRLRLAQEHNEQMEAIRRVQESRKARNELEEYVLKYWASLTGKDGVHTTTFRIVMSFIKDFGLETVLEWIEIAHERTGGNNDKQMGRYISGIRRKVIADMEAISNPPTPEPGNIIETTNNTDQ